MVRIDWHVTPHPEKWSMCQRNVVPYRRALEAWMNEQVMTRTQWGRAKTGQWCARWLEKYDDGGKY
jgi:hypothetical protein